jgi:predicted transcriptional regulator
MKIVVTMANGKQYVLDQYPRDFFGLVKNQLGVLINGLIEVKEGVWINPTNISTVEVLDLTEAKSE